MKLKGFALAGAALLLSVAGPALAALGGSVDSVQSDRAQMKGALRVTGNATDATVSIHEISTAYGTRVREYSGADGRVFAVAWNGPVNPDFEQLLGSYYAQYLKVAAATHGGHRHFSVAQPDLVMQNDGRQRAFAGRAWVPALVPQGFATSDIH